MRATLGRSEMGSISQSESVQGTPEGGTHFTCWLHGFLECGHLRHISVTYWFAPFPPTTTLVTYSLCKGQDSNLAGQALPVRRSVGESDTPRLCVSKWKDPNVMAPTPPSHGVGLWGLGCPLSAQARPGGTAQADLTDCPSIPSQRRISAGPTLDTSRNPGTLTWVASSFPSTRCRRLSAASQGPIWGMGTVAVPRGLGCWRLK